MVCSIFISFILGIYLLEFFFSKVSKVHTYIYLRTQNITHYIQSHHLTFFFLEICCTYSIAGLRRCIFFDIKTFIGGRPLFWIFKPIESDTIL